MNVILVGTTVFNSLSADKTFTTVLDKNQRLRHVMDCSVLGGILGGYRAIKPEDSARGEVVLKSRIAGMILGRMTAGAIVNGTFVGVYHIVESKASQHLSPQSSAAASAAVGAAVVSSPILLSGHRFPLAVRCIVMCLAISTSAIAMYATTVVLSKVSLRRQERNGKFF